LDIITIIASVFIASIIELWLAIPLGLYLNLNPLLIIIISSVGSILSAVSVIFLGEGVRNWFIKRRYGDKTPDRGKIYEIWKRYGVIGLGLLSPLVFGAPLGAAVGIGLGANKNRLLFWMAVGIVIWSIILTAAGLYGVLSFQSLNK
jgi:membrane protein YqaA with SNARE-associated domain